MFAVRRRTAETSSPDISEPQISPPNSITYHLLKPAEWKPRKNLSCAAPHTFSLHITQPSPFFSAPDFPFISLSLPILPLHTHREKEHPQRKDSLSLSLQLSPQFQLTHTVYDFVRRRFVRSSCPPGTTHTALSPSPRVFWGAADADGRLIRARVGCMQLPPVSLQPPRQSRLSFGTRTHTHARIVSIGSSSSTTTAVSAA